jgi:uncharacterized protein (DUF427 family)
MAVRMAQHLMSSLSELRFEPVTRRIRCLVDDVTVADTTDAMLVWEPRRIVPVYGVPPDDTHAELVPFRSTDSPASPDLDALPPVLGPENFGIHTCPGEALSLRAGGRDLPGVAFRPDAPELGGRITLDWPSFDWTEEEQPVIGHPHDPFKRIDVLSASRHVVVSLDGVTLGDSRRPMGVFETHLPPRWYLPRQDVRMDLLAPSETTSVCAYKGHASYFSLASGSPAGRDIAWTYTDPLHEVAAVKDRVCFFAERTDLELDGERMRRPVTPWSTPEEQAAPGMLDFA